MAGQNATKRDSNPDEVDRAIARAVIQNPGLTDADLGKALGLSRSSANRRRNSASVRSLVAEALSLPTLELRRLVLKGLEKLEAHLDDADKRISLSAAAQLARLGSALIEDSVRKASDGDSEIVVKVNWADETAD